MALMALFSHLLSKNSENTPEKHSQHQWELLLRTYCPPLVAKLPENAPESLIQKASFGFTTLLWECTVGKETKKEEILGTEPLQLDELVSKVDQHGSQYFQKNGFTYAIGKIQGQGQVIPLK